MTCRDERRVLVAHPSADQYGSDIQMINALDGLRDRGWAVTVVLPEGGPLVSQLRASGHELRFARFPVLRKATMTARGLAGLALRSVLAVARLALLMRRLRPDVVYVNTITIPVWILAARVARIPVIVHIREAEEDWPRAIRFALNAPLVMAHSVVANSDASRTVAEQSVRRLGDRVHTVYNGIAGPEAVVAAPVGVVGSGRVALVARLSPRKGVDVALEAVALLRGQGRDVCVDVCGSVFAGYEWFEAQLRERAAEPDLAGAVRFLGYVNPTWPVLASADVVVVPSRVEPFGNTAVEGLLAQRPVVASAVQGLAEIVRDGATGVLVPPGDAVALAGGIARVLDDPEWAGRIAVAGREDAVLRFSVQRYRADIAAAVSAVLP